MAQFDLLPESPLTPRDLERARRYEHAAVGALFDAVFDDMYLYCHALTADHVTAEDTTWDALGRLLDDVAEWAGDAAAITARALVLASESVLRVPRSWFVGKGLREDLSRLPRPEHSAVTLRMAANVPTALVAAAESRRPSAVDARLLAALRVLRGAPLAPPIALPATGRQLEAALEAVAAGKGPAEAAGLAPRLADAEQLLTLAAAVARLPRQGPSAQTRARVRNRFLAAADERRVRWVQRHQMAPVVPGRLVRTEPRRAGTISAVLFACVLALVSGAAVAGATFFAGPDSPLYPAKRASEAVLVSATPTQAGRAALEVKIAQEKSREAQAMAAGRHPQLALAAERDHFDALRASAAYLAASRTRDAKWKSARNDLEAEASKPVDTLEHLLVSNGARAEAEAVQKADERFQTDRKAFDKTLGVQSTAPGAATQPGAPAVAPSAVPAG